MKHETFPFCEHPRLILMAAVIFVKSLLEYQYTMKSQTDFPCNIDQYFDEFKSLRVFSISRS